MGTYFRKRIKIMPGININLSKSGASLSVGPKGAKMNFGKRGTYVTTGIPGTGIYSRTKISESNTSNSNMSVKNQAGCCFLVFFSFLFIGFSFARNFSWAIGSLGIGVILYILFSKKNKKRINDSEVSIMPEEIVLKKAESSEIKSSVKCNIEHIDPLFEDAARLIVIHKQGSTSLIQRKFTIGYNRAGRIMDQLECAGIVSATNGSKAREVLCLNENDIENKLRNLNQSQFDILFQREKEGAQEALHQESLYESSRLIKLGIDLEKEGMIDEAISVYEKAIIPLQPATHPYDRLMVLYRKRKDYENEIRVIKTAISVFMKENERRAGRTIEENSSLYNEVMQALETNESIRYDNGKWAFVQYNVMDYITRFEKTKRLYEKSKEQIK